MGSRIGHVLPGVVFIAVGLWHLYNHTKLYCRRPRRYDPPTWFPVPGAKHLELHLLVLCSLTYLITENIVGPAQHYPLDPADWSIPASHLHNFEHSVVALSFLIYGALALRIERARPPAGRLMQMLVGAAVFAANFLMFHLHSTDHTGVEWQYHWLLQAVIAVSLATTVLGVRHPRSFAVAFTRSASILFQGIWYVVTGVMLYSPSFIPKGCQLQNDEGYFTVPCDGPASVRRAKALVNLQFAWSLAAAAVFSVWLFLRLAGGYPAAPDDRRCGVAPVAATG